jgi:hypothetical protein
LKKPITKKRLVEWLKVEDLSLNPSPQERKKRERERERGRRKRNHLLCIRMTRKMP